MMEYLKLKETESSHGQELEQSIKLEPMSTADLHSKGTHSVDLNLARSVKVISIHQSPSESSDCNVYPVIKLPQSIKVEPSYYPNEVEMTCSAVGPSVLDVKHHLVPAELCTNLSEGPTKRDALSMLESMLETAQDRALFQDNHCDRKLHSVSEHKVAQLQETQMQHRPIHRENSFKCKKFDNTFINGYSLSHHKAVHRVGDEGTKCKYCDKVLSSRKSLARHLLTHTSDRPFKCRHCGKGCLTHTDRRIHEERRHNNTVQYKCTECNVSFISSSSLDRHNKTLHADERIRYKCPLCPKWFLSKRYVTTRHINEHKGDDRPFFKCEECGKIFYNKTCLKSHMDVHSVDKPFMCQHCGKSFVSSERLEKHIGKCNSGGVKQKQFTCFDCGKVVSNKNKLIEHMNIHNGVKPHTCEICGKSFTREVNLIQHIVIHSGDKPFKCNLCDKAFSWKSHLSSHLRSHTGVKPHQCPQCTKCFTQRSGLRLHMKSIHKMELAYKNSSASSAGSSAATVQ